MKGLRKEVSWGQRMRERERVRERERERERKKISASILVKKQGEVGGRSDGAFGRIRTRIDMDSHGYET